jgi:hypothetical protein
MRGEVTHLTSAFRRRNRLVYKETRLLFSALVSKRRIDVENNRFLTSFRPGRRRKVGRATGTGSRAGQETG